MRSDARVFHDGPEHELQFEAGYIGARPKTASLPISLATHGWSIHSCQKPTMARLFDHLVGEREQLVWNIEVERPRRLDVDDQLELGRLHDREIGWPCAFEYPAG